MHTIDSHPRPDPRAGFTVPPFAILIAIGALILLNAYFAITANSLQQEVATLRTSLKSEMASLRDAQHAANEQRQSADRELQKMVEAVEQKALESSAKAGWSVRRYTEQLTRKISDQHAQQLQQTSQKLQQSSQDALQQLNSQLGEVKQAANMTSTKVSGIASEVTEVKTAVASTKSEVDRILSEMRSVRGDLGVQSGLIATNARELAALKALGERDYVEFQLAKSKSPQRIGDVAVQLKKSDVKRSRYSIELVSGDKKVEKKDRSINEPVQFYMARARVPYEIVVNEVRRDLIVGYLAAPKVKDPRQ